MNKNLTGIIAIIIIVVLIAGGVGAYYYLGGGSESNDQPEPEPEEKNRKPIAFFTGNTSGIVGQTLFFDANGSKDNDGVIVYYEWDFGDGGTFSSSNSTIANNTYFIAGTYTVNLTVRDNKGATDSYSQTVKVRPQDFEKSQTTVLLERIDINEINETFPVEIFVSSVTINATFTGASSGGLSIGDTELELTIYDPYGVIIANETKGTRLRNAYMDFYFDDPELLINGEYEMIARCTKGALYLSYNIMVRY